MKSHYIPFWLAVFLELFIQFIYAIGVMAIFEFIKLNLRVKDEEEFPHLDRMGNRYSEGGD